MNESEMNKQFAANASLDHDRMRYVNALFNGTSNTKRQRLYQEFGYPLNLTFDDFSGPTAVMQLPMLRLTVWSMAAGRTSRTSTKAIRLRMPPSKRNGISA